MTHSNSIAHGNAYDLYVAAGRLLQSPIFLQCREYWHAPPYGLDYAQTWLADGPSGRWTAVYQGYYLGVAFEDEADAVMFTLRWGDTIDILELGPECLTDVRSPSWFDANVTP
ncbi:hypothetical protein [Brevundimonas sp. TWP3-1-2b1]|uniref:hypothetical protein n=1 Tax=Brevundimonas sp. TWP3-1-2b1 TaxID=2804650 RepID=UPI003CED6654